MISSYLFFAPDFPLNSKATLSFSDTYEDSFFRVVLVEAGTLSVSSSLIATGVTIRDEFDTSFLADNFSYSTGSLASVFLEPGTYYVTSVTNNDVSLQTTFAVSFSTAANPTPTISDISLPVSSSIISSNTKQILSSNVNALMLTGEFDLTFDADSRDNVLFGNDGFNKLSGGAGNDYMDGQHGNDTIDGGIGDDIIHDFGEDNLLNGGAGNDTIDSGSGDDLISGGVGNDTINAGSGYNSIQGGEGNDIINSSYSKDNIDGGDGNDMIDVGSGHNTVQGGKGDDTINAGSGNDKIDAGDGNDTINAGQGRNLIMSGKGNDSIMSGSRVDKIDAGDGNDTIDAGTGNDKIDGGAGIDRLIGSGNDTLIGGADADTFVLSLTALNTVTDFKTGVDKLVFTDALTPNILPVLDASHFVTSATSVFTFPAADSYGYNTKTGALFHDVDGSGAEFASVQIALIANKAPLVYTDILI